MPKLFKPFTATQVLSRLFFLILILSLQIDNAESAEMSVADCYKFLPYHSYNVATAGICGELLPLEVTHEHTKLRQICTRLLGEKKTMELMKDGVKEFKQNQSQSGSNEIFCATEKKILEESK